MSSPSNKFVSDLTGPERQSPCPAIFTATNTSSFSHHHSPAPFLVNNQLIFTTSFQEQGADTLISNIMSPSNKAMKSNDNQGLVPWSWTILLIIKRALTLLAQLIQYYQDRIRRASRYYESKVSKFRTSRSATPVRSRIQTLANNYFFSAHTPSREMGESYMQPQ